MIKIFLLTGFLGAGKTTLLKGLLKSYSGSKIGVVVNEFGEINVDARLIESNGIQLAELSNGSIFCACIKEKFVDSLVELSQMDLEYLFIEASGLADPANMGQILEGIKAHTKGRYRMEGTICVVDGHNFLELMEILPALENQVAYASAVIVNKADMIDDQRVEEIKDAIRSINQAAPIYITAYCDVDIRTITDQFQMPDKKPAESTNTFESRPKSFIVTADSLLSVEGLEAFLQAIAADSYRIKGFAHTDKGILEVSGVVDDIALTNWDKPADRTEIVIISSVGIRMMSQILQASKEHLGGSLRLK